MKVFMTMKKRKARSKLKVLVGDLFVNLLGFIALLPTISSAM